MSDGFSPQNDQLTQDPAPALGSVMDPKAKDFAPMITTTDVVGGMPGVPKMVQLTSNEGSVFAEHHAIHVLPITSPGQDVPPGETKAQA